jgi:hypothetical protein
MKFAPLPDSGDNPRRNNPYSGFTMKLSMWLLSAVLTAAAPAVAAGQMSLQWNQLAYYVEGHKLTVTADGAAPFEGKCLRVDYDGLIFENPNGPVPVKLARYKVATIKVSDIGGRQMTRLAHRTGPALNYGRKAIFSPAAPLGLVVTPAVVAHFLISTPFCLIGDLFATLEPPLEIRVVDKAQTVN